MKDLAEYIVTREVGKTIESSRLHAYLWIKGRHRDWIKARIKELGLVENVDYVALKISRRVKGRNNGGSTTFNEYHLNQRAAEHIGMAEHNEAGSKIRDAFIRARDERDRLMIAEEERKSKEARKGLAGEWARRGLKGSDFGRATVKEYEVCFNDRGIRKASMNDRQKKILGIFETTEGLKLAKAPGSVQGLAPICKSISETGLVLADAFKRLGIS